ncbi:MAG: hypothetical protein SFW35_12645 [Chitinophagales bacterium]|nr:hypothetical protein [Chitinophagales bacterium]
MKSVAHLLVLGFALLATLLGSCRKEQITDDPAAKLRFSTDTLTFDTVFTTLGTTTLRLKIFNDKSQIVRVSSIDLAGGDNSNFRINVDGIPGSHHEDIEILPNDSLYIFVEATVDPTNADNPIVIFDSIQFRTNGNAQRVVLAAWGQDAHFYNGVIIGSENWVNDKPYVIINSMQVDTGAKLTIQPGVRVYCSANSGILVSGSIEVNGGCNNDSVVFQGLRLEDFYDDVPGQWQGIFVLRADGNPLSSFTNAVIKNSNFGLTIGSAFNADLASFTTANAPRVTLNNVTIKNNFSSGLFCTFSTVTGTNILAYNSGDNLLTLGFGGTYDFKHCTFVNYGSTTTSHEKQILLVSNVASNGEEFSVNELNATFTNSILHGSLDEELNIVRDTNLQGTTPYNLLFDHCLLKTEIDTPSNRFVNVVRNTDPEFKNRGEGDFHLDMDSPGIDAGKGGLAVPQDLDCIARTEPADLGCYEHIP